VKKSRFTEEQIAFALKQAELGTKVDEICRKLRMLTLVDGYSRESLAIHVGQSLKGEDVVQVLNGIAAQRGRPQVIKSDNGSEFAGKAMDKWADEHRVALDFSRPGRPTDNAMVESFNGRLRQE
jgi:putative transposase